MLTSLLNETLNESPLALEQKLGGRLHVAMLVGSSVFRMLFVDVFFWHAEVFVVNTKLFLVIFMRTQKCFTLYSCCLFCSFVQH